MKHPDFGNILADVAGRTLYLSTDDERKLTNCYEGCASAFPPVLTGGEPSAEEGITASRVGTITRKDGSTQVTYNGWPLYYFAADEQSGDAMGQNVGDTWYVVSSYGGPIHDQAMVKVSEHPELGAVLTEASGRTIYLFTVDERNRSNCLGGCALVWPPLLTVGDPAGDEGVSAGRLGTIQREDGYTQVTYNGWPLYYFAPDEAPGDAKGQNSGDVWFVLSTHGGPIQNNTVVMASDHPEMGTILTEASGRTVYLTNDDDRGKPTCTRGCALAWPPLLTVGDPTPDGGVTADLLGTTTREDGYIQVTYNGWPLYYFAADQMPGDAIGQNVGDVWFVVSTPGEAVTAPVPTPPSMVMEHATPVHTPTSVSTVVPSAKLAPTPTAPAPAKEPSPTATTAQVAAPTEQPAPTATAPVTAEAPSPTATFAPADSPTPSASPAPAPATAVATRPTPTPRSTATAVLKEPSPTPTPTRTATPTPSATPSSAAISSPPAEQELATIEDYAASAFFPPWVVVVKDVPLKLHMTRLHREHVNQFTIEPFLNSTNFFAPGTVGLETFTPDESGRFRMYNVGHGHEGDFIVVDSLDEAKKLVADRGVQEFSLVHDLEGGRIIPSRIVVQQGIPVKIYNTSLKGDARVSIEPFYTAAEVNVKRGRITIFEFTPNVAGEFTIRYDDHDTTGTLVVEQ